MKKFYSTAIAALCALGVSAAVDVSPMRTDFMGLRLNNAEKSSNLEKVSDGRSIKNIELRKIKSRAEVDADKSIAGEYYIYIGDLFWQTSVGDVQFPATITQQGNEISIDCEFFATPFIGTYDETTGVISFSKYKVGVIENVQVSETEYKDLYLRLEPITGVDERGYPISGDYEVTYDAESGIIEFPELHGFGWYFYSDSRYGMFFDYLDLLIIYGLEDATNWDLLGNGVFTDNAMAPGFGKTAAPYEVEVYQSTSAPEIYKVVNPWAGLFKALNFRGTSPTIYLDATDKDNVLLELTTTNINGGPEDGLYYICNDGWICAEEEETPEAYTTLTENNGTITFTFQPNSLLLFASTANEIYALGETASTIVINSDANEAGISDIAVDENAPVEYFNLQGVRIDNPAAGQVVIKRQGSKAVKTLVR